MYTITVTNDIFFTYAHKKIKCLYNALEYTTGKRYESRNMEVPGNWSSNVVRNFERIVEWCEAIKYMSNISTHDYQLYMTRTAYHIKDECLQSAIQNYSCNFGILLKWIHSGIIHINENPRLPKMCQIDIQFDHKKFETVWKKHVTQERQVLDDLIAKIDILLTVSREKLKCFYEEMSDEYSSYSDYSEDTTSSYDEEEEEEEEKEEEEADTHKEGKNTTPNLHDVEDTSKKNEKTKDIGKDKPHRKK